MNRRKFRKTCAVGAAGAGQTFAVYRAQVGDVVRQASLKTLTSAAGGSTATWNLGDGGSATRYLSAASAVQAVGAFVSSAAVAPIYSAVDTVSLVYTPGVGPGAVAPIVEVLLELESVQPRTT